MKIVSHKVQNFLGLGEAHIRLSDAGLVLIQGQNDDDTSQVSNGSGKSSLADSVFWALYGETARGLSGDAVINETEGKNCRVETQFETAGETYRVTRWRKCKGMPKPSGLMLEKLEGSDWTDITKGKDTLTQTLLESVLGCSKEVFTGAVYAGQEKMPDLPNMTDRQLKTLIEEAAGITRIEAAYEISRQRLNDLKKEQAEKLSNLESAQKAVASQESDIDRLVRAKSDWDIKRGQRLDAARTRFLTAFQDAKDMSDKVKAIDTALIKSRKNEADELIASKEAELAGIDTKISEALADNGEKELRDRISESSRKEAVISSRLQMAADEFNRKKAEYQNVQSKIGTACKSCGKTYEEGDLKAASQALKEELLSLKGQVDDYKSQKNKLAIAHNELKRQLEEKESARANVSGFNAERATIQKAINDARKTSQEAHRELSDASGLRDTLERQKARVRELQADVTSIEEEDNPFITVLSEAGEKLELLRDEVGLAIKDYDDVSEAVEDMKSVATVFGPKGVRAHILDTVTPFLNERTAGYLSALSDGNLEAEWSTLTENAKGELSEKFSISVAKANMGSSFAAISGGEKRKVRIACSLALQDLVASRASKPIELWIGDEIDDAMDPAGLERLMTLLENKAKEKGTVLVISHNDLADWIRDTVIVQMKDSKAKVKGVLNYV